MGISKKKMVHSPKFNFDGGCTLYIQHYSYSQTYCQVSIKGYTFCWWKSVTLCSIKTFTETHFLVGYNMQQKLPHMHMYVSCTEDIFLSLLRLAWAYISTYC